MNIFCLPMLKREAFYQKKKRSEDMIQVVQLHGTDDRLYRLVARLVMDPEVLKQNYNYPFRTSENYEWFIVLDDERVTGFMPVEQKKKEYVINNYYVEAKDAATLKLLLESVTGQWNGERPLIAVCFLEDREVFGEQGFIAEKVWTRYVRMKKE